MLTEQTTVDTDHPKAPLESQKHIVGFKKKVLSNQLITDVLGAKTLRKVFSGTPIYVYTHLALSEVQTDPVQKFGHHKTS